MKLITYRNFAALFRRCYGGPVTRKQLRDAYRWHRWTVSLFRQ